MHKKVWVPLTVALAFMWIPGEALASQSLANGPVTSYFDFSVSLKGSTTVTTPNGKVCVDSTLTGDTTNQYDTKNPYYIQLYTGSDTVAGVKAEYPHVFNVQYGYCWTGLSTSKSYWIWMTKTNDTNYYSGNVVFHD